VCERDGHSSKADVCCDVPDGMHKGGAEDLAKLVLVDCLQDKTVAGNEAETGTSTKAVQHMC
jgi:hypothetical protein